MMKTKQIWGLGLCLGSLTAAAGAETLAQRLLASYQPVQSVQCEIRKDTTSSAGQMRRLSRVYWRRVDQLHVDGVAPVRRRIVSDGATLHSYIDGDPKGYACPIPKLDQGWLISLRQIPGTPMDHLLRLGDAPEEELPAAAGFPVRRGYAMGRVYVALSLDASNRLARVEFFSGRDQQVRTGQYDYSSFQEPLPGVWIPLLHKASFEHEGERTEETTRVSGLAVNTALSDQLFSPATFFPGVTFTDNLDDLYGGKEVEAGRTSR